MSKRLIAILIPMAFLLSTGCSTSPTGDSTATTAPATVEVPAEFQNGEKLFNDNCRRCHGTRAAGTNQGPPLVHQTYEPNHHSDGAFQSAVRNGSQAHHWNFGNMPPTAGVSEQQVTEITAYVRFLQRQAGIE